MSYLVFYADIHIPAISHSFQKLVDIVMGKNFRLVLCGNSNAHSSLFGHSSNNSCGDDLEEFILANNLYVENFGPIPTYEIKRKDQVNSSFIDITLTLNVDFLTDWLVSRNENYSDQNTIHFKILHDVNVYSESRNCHSANWDLFVKLLQKRKPFP